MSDNKNSAEHRTSIGGQAIIEGVMMRGPFKTAMAVRKPDKEIEVKVDDVGSKTNIKKGILSLPIIRGCINFFESLIVGMKALMFSAEFIDIEGEEEEAESKFDKWLEEKFGDKIKDIVIYVSIFISLVMSIGLFILLPTLTTRGIEYLFSGNVSFIPEGNYSFITDSKTFTSITEGILRLVIFIGYLALVSQMKDIKRVFEYHGAEHKTIACYEKGEELTVENVKKHTRFHPRCGTNFLLFVMITSIIIFAFLPKTGILLRMLMRVLLLPVVAGVSYEIIKLAGRSTSKCVAVLIQPGLWLQRLTTREPDDSQIEVAIESIKAVIPDNKEDDKW